MLQTFAQIAVGYYSDKTVTKLGRRKPYIICSMVVRVISFLALTSPPSKSDGDVVSGWFTVFFPIYLVGLGCYNVPFDTWILESTKDDADFSKIRSVANPIGALFGAFIGFFVLRESPVAIGLIFAIGAPLSVAAAVLYVPNNVYRTAPRIPELIPSFRICMQSSGFRKLLVNTTCFSAAIAIFNSSLILILVMCFSVMKLDFAVTLVVYTSAFGGSLGVIFMILCNWLFKKYDKLNIMFVLLAVVFVLSIFMFFLTLASDSAALYIFIIFGSTIIVIGFGLNLINSVLLRDLIMFDSLVTGKANMFCMRLVGIRYGSPLVQFLQV